MTGEDSNKLTKTIEFYSNLMNGAETRGIWGKDSRFSPEKVAAHPSVAKFYTPIVAAHVNKTDKVLDFGCGPGTFFGVLAPLCAELKGLDVVPSFIDAANLVAQKYEVGRHAVADYETLVEQVGPDYFDAIIMTDVLHHTDSPRMLIEQAHFLLKPGGKLIIFEPNRLNILLFIMCLLDKNERGLLRMGNMSFYSKLVAEGFQVIASDWNAVLVGFSSRLALMIADFFQSFPFGILRWMLPKIYLVARKR